MGNLGQLVQKSSNRNFTETLNRIRSRRCEEGTKARSSSLRESIRYSGKGFEGPRVRKTEVYARNVTIRIRKFCVCTYILVRLRPFVKTVMVKCLLL